MALPAPTVITVPFATSGTRNVIPVAPVVSPLNAASYTGGFPPDTAIIPEAGGLPPLYPDFQGVLFDITSNVAWQQYGQGYAWNSVTAAANGGYQVGALLARADGSGYWFNIAANNATNPDSGGAGWVPAFNYGQTSIALSNANVTLTAPQYAKGVIILTGTLTGNVQVILPTTLQSWLIVNQTTGAFTVTVKTAAGTGVIVAQSGPSSPSPVWGNGTNIYSSVPAGLTLTQALLAGILWPRTQQEINAGVTPTNYVYQQGDIRRYGAAMNGTTADDAAWQRLYLVMAQGVNGYVPPLPTLQTVQNTLAMPTTYYNPIMLSGYGCTLYTTGAIDAIQITGPGGQIGGVIVAGFTHDITGGNPLSGAWPATKPLNGFSSIGGNYVEFRDCQVIVPSSGTASTTYACCKFTPTADSNGFYHKVTNLRMRQTSGATGSYAPYGVLFFGQCNRGQVNGSQFTSVNFGVGIVNVSGADYQQALANGVQVSNNSFDGIAGAVLVNGNSIAGTHIDGLGCQNNDWESCSQGFLILDFLEDDSTIPTSMINNPNISNGTLIIQNSAVTITVNHQWP